MNASSLAVLQKKHNGASRNVNKSFNLALPCAKLKSHVYLAQEIKNPVGQWYFPFNLVWRSIVATSCVGSVPALNMRGEIRPLLLNWPGAARHRPTGSETLHQVISCSYAKPRVPCLGCLDQGFYVCEVHMAGLYIPTQLLGLSPFALLSLPNFPPVLLFLTLNTNLFHPSIYPSISPSPSSALLSYGWATSLFLPAGGISCFSPPALESLAGRKFWSCFAFILKIPPRDERRETLNSYWFEVGGGTQLLLEIPFNHKSWFMAGPLTIPLNCCLANQVSSFSWRTNLLWWGQQNKSRL